MSLTKRQEKILEAMRDGELIYRHWNQTYLQHSLKGIERLKESEVKVLMRAGLIRYIPREEVLAITGNKPGWHHFPPLQITPEQQQEVES